MNILPSQLLDFVRESNSIEGELLKPNGGPEQDMFRAIEDFLKQPELTEDVVLRLHKALTYQLNVDWSGRWRELNVQVSGYHAPSFQQVPLYMEAYFDRLPSMDSYKAHNEFEKIHPFVDFNGRVGRAVWLWVFLRKEAGSMELSFLHRYYYQTLSHYSSNVR